MDSKIAYITGASSGIGMACAKRLAALGCKLIIAGRRKDRLENLKKELETDLAAEVFIQTYDIRKREEVASAIQSLPEKWQSIDILINNAGLASGLSPLHSGDIDDWEKMIDTNVKGLLYISRAIIPLMIKNSKQAHIINIGSIAGKEVYANGNVYCSTKHAVDALSKAMRIELSSYPIKVSAIHPGAVETEFSIVRFHGDTEKAAKVYDGFDNLVADDIADAIEYMLTRPAHVNINDMIIMPTAQPVASVIHRK